MEEQQMRLARLSDAGQMLGISESAVRRLVLQGELRAVKIFADMRIPISEIDAMISRKLTEANCHVAPAAQVRPPGKNQ